SGLAHASIARIWLDPSEGQWLEGAFVLSSAVAIAFAVRRRLVATIGEGVRAIARPALVRSSPGAREAVLLVVAGVGSAVVRAALAPFVGGLADAPLAVGAGLLLTASTLATTALAPRGQLESPSYASGIALGLAQGLAIVPGVSAVAIALAALVWAG